MTEIENIKEPGKPSITELLNRYEESPCSIESNSEVTFWDTPSIENECDKAILDRIHELTSDQFIRFQFIKRGRLYKNDYFIPQNRKIEIEQASGKPIKELYNDPFTGINSEKMQTIISITYNIDRNVYNHLIKLLSNEKDGDKYVDQLHYDGYHYWDPNDSKFQQPSDTFQYIEAQHKNTGEKLEEPKLLSTPEEYEAAKNRHAHIEKRQFKTKWHTFIADIIRDYENKSNVRDIFDDFEGLKKFIVKRTLQYTNAIKVKLTYRDVTDTSQNHTISMGTSKVSREMTREKNQEHLFSNGGFIEIGNGRNNCDMKVWLEECDPQLPSNFIDCLYEKKLCTFDNALSDVLGSFFNSKNFVAERSFVSEDDILNKMSGGDQWAFRNTELKDRVKKSIMRMDAIRAKVDYTALENINAFGEEGRNLALLESCTKFERVLNIDPGIIKSKNGKEVKGFFFNQVPLLYRVSEALNQRITIEEKHFNIEGVQNTPDTFLIIHYLIIEITRNNSPKGALFESIIKNSGVEGFGTEILKDRTKKARFKKKLEKIFEQWKKVNLISSYTLRKDKVSWTNIKLIESKNRKQKRHII